MSNSINENSQIYIKSPKTGRLIKVGGPTYQKLSKSKKYGPILSKSPKVKNKTLKGCSNVGKYPKVAVDEFCGPEGGSCPGTYPVNTRGRARAALAYARHAPDPEGIKNCVRRKSSEKGWLDSKGKLKM